MATPPQVMAQDCIFLDQMRADATHLYWACNPGMTIRRMPLAGGTIETVYQGPGSYGGGVGFAVDNGFVYITQNRGSAYNYDGLVLRVPAGGGTPVTLLNPTGVSGIAVQDGWVFYTDTYDYQERIMRVSVDGGTPHFVVRTRADALPGDLTAGGGGSLFYSDWQGVMRVDVQTKQITGLTTGLIPGHIDVDDQFVYFIGCTGMCADASAYRVPRAGGAIAPLGGAHSVASTLDAIDDSLQWGSHVLSLSGGPERTLLDTEAAFVVAATPQAFYFGETTTGRIYRVAR